MNHDLVKPGGRRHRTLRVGLVDLPTDSGPACRQDGALCHGPENRINISFTTVTPAMFHLCP